MKDNVSDSLFVWEKRGTLCPETGRLRGYEEE